MVKLVKKGYSKNNLAKNRYNFINSTTHRSYLERKQNSILFYHSSQVAS